MCFRSVKRIRLSKKIERIWRSWSWTFWATKG